MGIDWLINAQNITKPCFKNVQPIRYVHERTWAVMYNACILSCSESTNIFQLAAASISTSNVPHNSLIETCNATCRYRRLRWLTRPTFSPPYIVKETSLVLRVESFSLWKFVILFLIAGYVTLANESREPAETWCFLNGRNSIVCRHICIPSLCVNQDFCYNWNMLQIEANQ